MSKDFQFRVLTRDDWKNTDTNLTYADGLHLKPEYTNGSYISPPLDSGIPGCRWHRIVLDADIGENASISVSFSVSETGDTGENWSGGVVFFTVKDALIPGVVLPGQYISLKIDFHVEEGAASPLLRQVKIYYQRISYLRYLPAQYRENPESRDFLERFLSIFESSFYDNDELISSLPFYFDPESAPFEFYRWLAGWLSLDLYDLLEEKNREFILRATEFYKQKGTVPGIASLVSFLTGRKTCIKEYRNNVFRSYGMEHDSYERDIEDITEVIRTCMVNKENAVCTRFCRRTSKTVDTKNLTLLGAMGTYCDQVHYVTDTGKKGRYSPHVIGIFIFLPQDEKQFLIDKEQLLKIINSFLPVFVRAEITIIEVSYKEEYPIQNITESFNDTVKQQEEEYGYVTGSYEDTVSWSWLRSYSSEYMERDVVNNQQFRTPHTDLGVEHEI